MSSAGEDQGEDRQGGDGVHDGPGWSQDEWRPLAMPRSGPVGSAMMVP